MQRLSLDILKEMFRKKLTRCEIGFLLCVSRYQDQGGCVKGVYYKEISEEMGCSYPQFYAAMRSLEEKGFIRCAKNNYYDHDITVIGNDYRISDIYGDAGENFRRKPYINTRHEIFYSRAFMKMKPGAQLMAMDFMGVTRLNKGMHCIRVENFFKKYQGLLDVSRRTIRTYITQLKGFFSIGIKDGKYWIRPKVGVYRDGGNTETENYNEQQIRMTCRRNRIQAEEKEIKEVRGLVKQYGRKAAAAGRDALAMVLEAVRRSVDSLESLHSEEPVLKNRLVHLWVRKLLDMGEDGKKREKPAPAPKNRFHNFPQRDYDFDALEGLLLNI